MDVTVLICLIFLPFQLQRLLGSVHDENGPSGTGDGIKSKAQKDAENILTKTMTNSDSLSNLHELTIDDTLASNRDSYSAEDDCNVPTTIELPVIPMAPPLPIVVPPVEPTALISVPTAEVTLPEKSVPHPPPPPALPIRSTSESEARLPQSQIYWMKKHL